MGRRGGLSLASSPGHPGRANEDFVGAVPDAVVLVDGAGIRDAEHLCRHGTAWYAAGLGSTLLARLASTGEALDVALAAAVDEVTDRHRDTCAVGDPSSPSASVAVARVVDGRAEHLVLGDSVVVWDVDPGPVVVDDRREPVLAYQLHDQPLEARIAALRAARNRPGGFFVAKDDGRVAGKARTGSLDAEPVRAVALLSNGASRAVDRFGLITWAELFGRSPQEVIALVREAEAQTGTACDDATAALWRLGAS